MTSPTAPGGIEAEDRGLLLQQGRYDSRVAAIDAPGLSALSLISGLSSSPRPRRPRPRWPSRRTRCSPTARRAVPCSTTSTSTSQGINDYLAAHGGNPHPFTRNDIYALNALKGQFVGEGGGDEAVRSEFLSGLRHRLGTVRGTKVWHDLREAYDPETPTSVPGVAHMLPPPRSTRGNVVLDNNSLSTSAVARPRAPSATRADRRATRCSSPAPARRPITRPWSPARRSATTTRG